MMCTSYCFIKFGVVFCRGCGVGYGLYGQHTKLKSPPLLSDFTGSVQFDRGSFLLVL